MRYLVALAILIVLPGCRRDTPETASVDGAPGPPAIAPNSAAGDTAVGVEAEAPRLIPAMRAQLERLPSDTGTGSLESYRATVGQLIDAMEADLTRTGRIDSGGFKLLADSVLRELGGGAGDPKPDPEAARRSAPAVRRLIDLYQARMGQARVEP
jgi:ABC-type transporter Mla MlaB component